MIFFRLSSKSIVLFLIICSLFVGCTGNGYRSTKTGLKYRFIVKNNNAQKPEVGDILELKMMYVADDSVLFNSSLFKESFYFELISPEYKGDIQEGLAMMGVSDSAEFIIPLDSFFYKNIKTLKLPDFLKDIKHIHVYVKLISIKRPEGFEIEREVFQKQKSVFDAILKYEEQIEREAYFKKNNISVQPSSTGLFFIEIQKGNGLKPLLGSTITFHFKGYLLDSTLFVSTYKENKPEVLKIGNDLFQPGLEEALSMMQEGGKSKIILPSKLGFGSDAFGTIPAYSNLIFEIDLLKVE